MDSSLAITEQASQVAIRATDMGWYADLPLKEKEYLQLHLAAFARLDNADSIKEEARELSKELKSHGRGYSAKAIMDKYRKFKATGRNPKSLVRKWSNGPKKMPKEFVRFWRALVGQNKREDGTKGAYRRLKEEFWAAGEHVPGYGTWSQWFLRTYPNKPLPRYCPLSDPDLPHGWTYGNLNRLAPKKSVLLSMRKGLKSAHAHQKHFKSDRSKLRPMELIAIDDFWCDQLFYDSTQLGKKETFRAVGLMARCVATGIVLAWFIKPRTKDEFGKKQSIRKGEMQELVRLVLTARGLPPYPITLLVENASAAIDTETENFLMATFQGRVLVERTGLYKDSLLKNGFNESGGKPWEKSWIEHYIRLIHTSAGHLPAQTGSNYREVPANLRAIQKYTEQQLNHPNLGLEDIKKLRLSMLDIEDARSIYDGIIRSLEHRTDHKMQGFEKVTVWRREAGDKWEDESTLFKLSPEEAESIEIYTRLESSVERWNRLCPPASEFWFPSPAMLWFLLPEVRLGRIKDGKVVINDNRIHHEPVEYWKQGYSLLREHEGERVMVCYNPSDASEIVLTTVGEVDKRRPLGILPRDNAVDITNRKATLKAAGAIDRERQLDIRTVREIAKEEDERLATDKAWNEHVIEQATKKAQGRRQSDQVQKQIEQADDLEASPYLSSSPEENDDLTNDDIARYLKD